MSLLQATIEHCTDGEDCPNAEWCRENTPDLCPMYDEQFIMSEFEPLDKVIKDDYL